MVAPALGFFLVFAIIPLIVALYLSFTRWDAITDPAWVGLDNWASVLVDPVAIDALVLTLKVIVISWIVQTPISLLLGTWTAGKQRNRAVLGAIFFLPLLLSSAATAIAFKAILDPNFGLSASLGIPFLKQDWLGNQQLVLFVLAIPRVLRHAYALPRRRYNNQTEDGSVVLGRVALLRPQLQRSGKPTLM